MFGERTNSRTEKFIIIKSRNYVLFTVIFYRKKNFSLKYKYLKKKS